ncbi:bifunctional diguanylate cyclase/phosphodiesterase [Noviherbaspirillum sp.]|uniref:bifunctional diguanylate cyclase/phosphodiesterase n=1 Tax=Noviherbaspirillum sp. TaxID=1926288 RepID=UPI002DDD864E|nr:EAL domain-containing protein [Noviherbaspirillum sp.]
MSDLWGIRSPGERRAAWMVLLGAALALLILWSAIAGILLRSRDSAINAERRILERMSSVVEEQACNFFSMVDFFLISASRVLEDHSEGKPHTDPDLLSLVKTLATQSGGRIGAHILSVDGTVHDLAEANRQSIGNIAGRDYFELRSPRWTNGLYIGMPEESSFTGQTVLPIFRAPSERRSAPRFLVVASIDTQALNTLYESGRTKPNGSIGLVRRDGILLARAPNGENYIGKSIAGGRLWKEHLPKAQRGWDILPNTVIDKTSRLTAYAAMEEYPLVVIASSSMDDVLAAWRKLLWGLLVSGSVLTCMTVVGARRLISLLKTLAQTRAEVENQARHDFLTGLPNRRAFHEQLEQEIRRAHRTNQSICILFIDLDLFKEINDTLGHDMGDLLLQQAALRISGYVRETDSVARLGGDEFTVILHGLNDLHGVERIAQGILKTLAEPFLLRGETAYVSASIGVALYPQDGTTSEELVKHADQAMYAAKTEGRNRWTYFAPSMQIRAQQRMRYLNDLHTALAEQQYRLVYQPIVDLRTGLAHKAEALIRWHHPQRGVIPPAEFIPVLEDAGMIAEVGEWVFQEAARQAVAWRKTLHPEFQISINKSPLQFRKGSASANDWMHYLAQLGLPGNSIAIEITEGLLLEPGEEITTKLRKLSDAGMQISLDDFGTGYCSLMYLKRFDIDFIKIDRTFVSALADGPDGAALCEAIIVMAHKLGLKVIAEGIETSAQRDLLVEMGCDFGQGFLFSRPLGAEEFARQFDRFFQPA